VGRLEADRQSDLLPGKSASYELGYGFHAGECNGPLQSAQQAVAHSVVTAGYNFPRLNLCNGTMFV
jgi:hypothetical protein